MTDPIKMTDEAYNKTRGSLLRFIVIVAPGGKKAKSYLLEKIESKGGVLGETIALYGETSAVRKDGKSSKTSES